jgi:hypothetical protein
MAVLKWAGAISEIAELSNTSEMSRISEVSVMSDVGYDTPRAYAAYSGVVVLRPVRGDDGS